MSARKLSPEARASLTARVQALINEGLTQRQTAERLNCGTNLVATLLREAKEAALTAQQWAERCGEVTKENER